MAARKGVDRYPRSGDRIAPITLRRLLLEEAPKHLVGPIGVAGLKLCDLDETVWQKLPREAIVELSRIIVARVAAGCSKRTLLSRRVPRPPECTKLDDLRLEHRTRLCLVRGGFEADAEALGDRTIGEILAIQAFGPRCLVDLLSSLETLLARGGRRNRLLTIEAKRLAALPQARLATCEDLRFGPLMDAVDVEAQTAKELADRLAMRTRDPPDPAHVAEQIRQLRLRLVAAPKLPLEEELIQIFASTPHERNGEIVAGYYGWIDGRRHTLAEIGARHGMTRERIRQICAKAVRRGNPASILAPVLDRTLAFIRRRLPSAAARLEAEMREAGLTAVGLRLESVRGAAGLLCRAVPFAVVRLDTGTLALRPQQVAVPPAAAELARKEIYYRGAATVGQIHHAVAEKFPGPVESALVAETLQLLDGFRWLDQQTGWFRLLSTAKHGLPKAIDKALAVAGRIGAGDLRKALSRNRRMWRALPPENVILEFCRQTPGVRVEGDQIIAERQRSWKTALTGVEAKLVGILKQHGPVMDRGALEDLCVAAGINRFSFHAFIASSPVIAQYGHSVYGLLGADVSAETVQSLVDRRRAQRAPTRVLHGHGRTGDGRIWLSYRLSRAASTYAVVTVPAALKDLVSGKFRILSTDGRHVGTLAAKDGRAWGLGAFLRQAGAGIDDHVLITLDLDQRTALISLGEEPPEMD